MKYYSVLKSEFLNDFFEKVKKSSFSDCHLLIKHFTVTEILLKVQSCKEKEGYSKLCDITASLLNVYASKRNMKAYHEIRDFIKNNLNKDRVLVDRMINVFCQIDVMSGFFDKDYYIKDRINFLISICNDCECLDQSVRLNFINDIHFDLEENETPYRGTFADWRNKWIKVAYEAS